MKVIAISGSLRRGSLNTALLREAQALAPADVQIELGDISDIPPFNSDIEPDMPIAVTALVEQIRSADAVLIATPEYNYSIPGVLKNAIDWVSRGKPQPFAKKPIAIMGASKGVLGTARAQYHLRQVFVFLDGLVMNRPEVFVGGAGQKFDDNGTLKDAGTRDFLGQYLVAFRDWTQAARHMAA